MATRDQRNNLWSEEQQPSDWLMDLLDTLDAVIEGAAWAGAATHRQDWAQREEAMEYMLRSKSKLLRELYRLDE